MREQVLTCEISYDRAIADHFPVVTTIQQSSHVHHVWLWPRPYQHVFPKKCGNPPLPYANSFTAWSETSRHWLQNAFQVSIPPKTALQTTLCQPREVKMEWRYRALLKANSLVHHLQHMNLPHYKQIRALMRKLDSLELSYTLPIELCELASLLKRELDEYVQTKSREALGDWKEKAKAWTCSQAAAHRYIRNDYPPKVTAIWVDGAPTNSPWTLDHELRSYWNELESWESDSVPSSVVENVVDLFGIFIPHVPCSVTLTGITLCDHAKRVEPSSPGPDGWSVSEIRELPEPAWTNLLELVNSAYYNSWYLDGMALLFLKRRTPIEKPSPGHPTADIIRPIDVFSVVLRCFASCLCKMLRTWTTQVIHHKQAAVHWRGPTSNCPACNMGRHSQSGHISRASHFA